MMKRILWGVVILLAAVAAAMVVVVAVFGGRLKDEALRQVNARVDAEVALDGMRVAALRHFPDLTLVLQGVRVDGVGEFEGIRLLESESAEFRVDVWDLLRGEMVVEGIAVNGTRVHVVGTADGMWNADILKEAEVEGKQEEPGDAGTQDEGARNDGEVSQRGDGSSGDVNIGDGSAGVAFRVESIAVRDLQLTVEDRAGGWWTDLEGITMRGALEGAFEEGAEAFRMPARVGVERMAAGMSADTSQEEPQSMVELGNMRADLTVFAPGPVVGLPFWVEGRLEAPAVELAHSGFAEPVRGAVREVGAESDGAIRVSGATLEAAGGELRLDGELPRVAQLAARMLQDEEDATDAGHVPAMDLEGRFKVSGAGIDVNRWLGAVALEEEEAEAEAWTGPVRIPEGVDIEVDVQVEDAVYGNVEIRDLAGRVELAERAAALRDVSMRAMGGRVTLDGSYDSRPDVPRVAAMLELQEIGFAESYRAMDLVRILAPLMERAQGTYSASLDYESALRPDLMPDLGTVKALGSVRTDGFSGSLPAMRELARLAGRPELDTLRTSPVNLSFRIEDGWMRVPPFEVGAAGVGLDVSGRGGLDGTLDFEVEADVPLAGESRVGAAVERLLSRVTKAPGTLRVRAHIGGKTGDPKVSLKGVETVR